MLKTSSIALYTSKEPLRVLIAAFGLFTGSFGMSAQAAVVSPDVYIVKLYEVSLCTDVSCGTKIVLGQSQTGATFDLAALQPGDEGDPFSSGGVAITPGTYTHFRMVLSRRVTTKGIHPVTYDDNGNSVTKYCVTNSSGRTDDAGMNFGTLKDTEQDALAAGATNSTDTAGGSGGMPSSEFQVGIITLDVTSDRFGMTFPLPGPITLTDTATLPEMGAKFNISSAFYAEEAEDGGQPGCIIGSDAPKFEFHFKGQTATVDLKAEFERAN